MSTRQASHAGSWYSSSSKTLHQQLEKWLGAVDPAQADDGGIPAMPVKGAKALIGPHAGFSYSGPTAAWAYKCIDTENIKRVFVIGPSHHVYLDGCALSRCDTYQTPVGDLPIDRDTVKELEATGKFSQMSLNTDQDEHSIEMHLPYVRKIFENEDIKIVPVLVGSISTSKETAFGAVLAPYLADPSTFFVVSSDFCHWGTRFSYTYYKTPDNATHTSLGRGGGKVKDGYPIHQSISDVDHEGMDHIALDGKNEAKKAHADFAEYLKRTKNTICGRHPIGVLLGAVATLQAQGTPGWDSQSVELRWTKYAQSSECETVSDSSVSYASAYLKAGGN